jgi:hypothetical protein
MRGMKVLVCGSRDWESADSIYERLVPLKLEAFKRGDKVTLIHGNAPGADRLARNLGIGLNFDVQTFPADWEKHGKRAGILRNLQMLDENPDLVIAFQRNGSRGTQHTIDEARKRGIPVEIHSA